MSLERLDGFRLEPPHPLAGRDAYQCPQCHGISYAFGNECPYCADAEDEREDDRDEDA